ncbi:MAG: peptidoglycan DD-metalloendopeptidase family protein [Firmicutes bacterium]|nr:peptidoglycan DD-metalloendopeptidase family protein [Bacillota bacterium]MCL5040228.1 peptidoglycan DD-metalloendopeptidase family protein [Bacillota bacterium]
MPTGITKKKGLALGLAMVLLFGALGLFFLRSSARVYAVEVDGRAIGQVKEPMTVDQAIYVLVNQVQQEKGLPVTLANQVRAVATKDTGAPPLSAEELQKKLSREVNFNVRGYMISVNGQPVVALADEKTAKEVLDGIRASYVEKFSGSNVELGKLEILEDTKITPENVSLDRLRNKEEAIRILLRGTDKVVIHTVQRGQSLWSIATSNRMTVDDLKKANPELNSEVLQIGQKLNLVVPEPYLTLVSSEKRTFTVNIPYSSEVIEDNTLWPWQQVVQQYGVYGKKEVTVEIKRQNGQEISREILQEKILSEPTTEVRVQGTKQIPQRGTGQYVWPTVGQITSGFGWRPGEFHYGVDIAAPTGTPILAADSGTVVRAEWYAGYGKMIVIDHGGGKVKTVYGHLSVILVDVGDTVEKGELIGKVGNTGRSTGPHLHFEIRIDGNPVNPLNYYRPE